MINLGTTYFYKYLDSCEPEALQERVESVRNILSTSAQRKYALADWELLHGDLIREWSKGIYGANEHVNRSPRVAFSLESSVGDYWVMEVLFTRIPSIRGHYGNITTKHAIPTQLEAELGTRLVASDFADVFRLKSSELLIGTRAGIYIHEKFNSIPTLRERVESGRYFPPGSELKDLIQALRKTLREQQGSSGVLKVPMKRNEISGVLQSCDEHVIGALGEDGLNQFLRSMEMNGDTWLKAGHRSRLWRFSFS